MSTILSITQNSSHTISSLLGKLGPKKVETDAGTGFILICI